MVHKKFKYYWKESKGIVLSLVVTAAVLPFVMWALISRQQVMTWAKASSTEQLMLWLEPAEVLMNNGQTVKFDVLAEYTNSDRVIPTLRAVISSTTGIDVLQKEIEYNFGFSGRKKIGSISVSALQPGEQMVGIEEKNVFTSLPDLVIVTAGAKIIVK